MARPRGPSLMPPPDRSTSVWRRVFRPVSRRLGDARRAVLRVLTRQVLPPQRDRDVGVARESADLVARTDVLNVAAEHYFQLFDNPAFLIGKPFSSPGTFGRHLVDLGTLVDALRLRPGDVVLELGAGSCWVSHFLNKFGCRTIAIDVSPTALALGRQLFDRDPATRWEMQPEFLSYDGHRLPLADDSCDRVIVVDAFHHVPNQREILAELHRVLAFDGVVGMCEPGTGHAETEAAKKEVEQFGVLENELVIEDVAALAKSCGFSDVRLIVSRPTPPWQIPAEGLGAFLAGEGLRAYWATLSDAMITGHYILMYKGNPGPTTRRPTLLDARITVDLQGAEAVRVQPGQSGTVTVSLTNSAETRWLAEEHTAPGWTRLGAHLFRDGEPQAVDFDWLRVGLPRDVSRDECVQLVVTLPPVATPGAYTVVLDLVIEGQAWFANRGSAPVSFPLLVGESIAAGPTGA
jgi:SAM-dependent methyltransferase